MYSLKKQLPPLDPLVAFEAAARHLSFTAAANEMHLSQAAVSQQIRNLEESLGVSLFIRSHRSVQLSTQGREFQHTVSTVLQQLASAATELSEPVVKTHLNIATDQSIASMWLMPRLPDFQQQYPDTTLRFIASDDEQDCLAEDIDIAIIHGNGSWPGFKSEQLFEEEIFPVCSPGYLAGLKTCITPDSLVDEILLELDDSHWDWMNWRSWLSRNNLHLPAYHKGLQINNYPLIIKAAKNGQGIALGWRYLIDYDLEKGLLIKPMEMSVRSSLGYYLVWPDQREFSATANAFREWSKNELIKQHPE